MKSSNNMNIYEKIITLLYKGLPKEKEKSSRANLLCNYYNQKYPTTPIFYSGRYLYNTDKRFKVDVRNFFTLEDENLKNIVKSLKMSTMTDNQKALRCLKFIIENIPYKSDSENYKVKEYWEYPYEVIEKGSSDCEGSSLLLANLMLISGIPNWKIRLVAGYVFEPISKKQIGHLFNVFFDEETEQWKILDATFYPNLKLVKDREEYKKEKMYQEVWFSFNNELSFCRDNADIRKMKNMEVNNGK